MSDQFTWTDDKIDKLHNLRANTDDTWVEIGERFGVTGNAARKAYKRHLEDRRDSNANGTPKIDIDRMPDFDNPEDIGWREWFDAYQDINDKHRAIDPIQEKLTVDLSDIHRPISVAFLGDLHIGGGFTDYDAAMRMIEYIIDTPGQYLSLLGDEIEGFIPGAKSAETSEQMAGSLKSQFNVFEDLVNELIDAGKLISVSWGDHSARWIEAELGFNTLKSRIHDKVPYFTGRGLINLVLGDTNYYLLVNHSERFASQWSDTHAARRAHEQFFPADVVATAHKHTPEWRTFWHYQEMRDAGLDVGGKAILLQTGTAKVGPDPYSVRRWNRGIFRAPTVVFWPDRKQKEVVESPQMSQALINGLREG